MKKVCLKWKFNRLSFRKSLLSDLSTTSTFLKSRNGHRGTPAIVYVMLSVTVIRVLYCCSRQIFVSSNGNLQHCGSCNCHINSHNDNLTDYDLMTFECGEPIMVLAHSVSPFKYYSPSRIDRRHLAFILGCNMSWSRILLAMLCYCSSSMSNR